MILIIIDRFNRAILALSSAVITYAILIFIEKFEFNVIPELLFGSSQDDFVELRAITLMMSMMIIVEIAKETGVFQFLAFRMIQMTGGKPTALLAMLCTLAVFLTAVLNNLLTIIVLIPLTFTVSKILHVNPIPYILSETFFVTIGGSILPISSIPSILITFYAKLTFIEFFINIGLISIMIYGLTLLLFLAMFSDKLEEPQEGIDILLEYQVWSFIENRKLMLKALYTLIAVLIGFMVIPSDILPSEIIALTAAMILMLISKLDASKVLEKIDLELILFLLGVSVVVGAMDKVELITALGNWLGSLSEGNIFGTIMIVLWTSAFLSAAVDDISITKVMIPVVRHLTNGLSLQATRLTYFSLSWGINFGDNMTPFGDTIMVFNIAEDHQHKIPFKMYFKYGLITSFFNLTLITIYISFYFMIWLAIILTILLLIAIIIGFFPRIKKRILKIKLRRW